MRKQKKVLLITAKGFKREWKIKVNTRFGKKKIQFCVDEKDKIIKSVKNCTAMIGCPRYVFHQEEYNNFQHLDWIHAGGAGIENFLTKSFKKSNTTFTNGKIIQGPEVADHAVGLILSFSRNLYFVAKKIKNLPRPLELFNKKVLIIGLGGIGICIAERLAAFGCEVDGITNDMPTINAFIKKVFYDENINELVKSYDIVICSAPLTSRTEKIFSYTFFKNMKKDSIFINVSRGKLVDTKSLIRKNIYKKFRGIGLDVTDPEPLESNHPLNGANNIFITPHIAGPSDKNRERGFDLIMINLKRYFTGRELLNIVNKLKEY